MSSATLDADPTIDLPDHDAASYRALHAGAIVGVLVSLCSLVYPLTVSSLTDVQYLLLMAAIPIVALVVSFSALRSIRANSEIYTGERAALAGVLISLASLVGGSAYGGYVFATEVPEGYTRTSFQQMKPSDDDREAGQPVPPAVQELIRNQDKVFIKGFIRPESAQFKRGNREFLLVRDNNQCCFGDMSKVMFYDQVQVIMEEGKTVDYDDGMFRLGGTLSVRIGNPALDEPTLVYSLLADYAQN